MNILQLIYFYCHLKLCPVFYCRSDIAKSFLAYGMLCTGGCIAPTFIRLCVMGKTFVLRASSICQVPIELMCLKEDKLPGILGKFHLVCDFFSVSMVTLRRGLCGCDVCGLVANAGER